MSIANQQREWDGSHAMYLTGRSYIDPVDVIANEMERKWGVDRLRLLVERELMEKFDRQRYLFAQAIRFGTMAELVEQAQRMQNAWLALDAKATELGRAPLSPEVWEVALNDGTVLAVCPDTASARGVAADGRHVAVVTLPEIAKLFEHFRDVVAVKLRYPGATVTAVRGLPGDPLDAIDTPAGLDTEMAVLADDPITIAG